MTIEIKRTKYRTFDNVDYTFDFVYVNGGWRVYIVSQPGYGPRSSSSAIVHRLSDARGQYICWDRTVPTLDAAKGVAAQWADCTQHYIKTGTFRTPPGYDQSKVFDWSSSANWGSSGASGDSDTHQQGSARPSSRIPPGTQANQPNTPVPRQGVLRRFFGSH